MLSSLCKTPSASARIPSNEALIVARNARMRSTAARVSVVKGSGTSRASSRNVEMTSRFSARLGQSPQLVEHDPHHEQTQQDADDAIPCDGKRRLHREFLRVYDLERERELNAEVRESRRRGGDPRGPAVTARNKSVNPPIEST